MNFKQMLVAAIHAAPDLPSGDAAVDVATSAIEAVASVDTIRGASNKRMAEILAVAKTVADTPWGKKIIADSEAGVLAALDKSRFKQVLAVARFIAGFVEKYGTIHTGNAFLDWLIQTALQAFRADATT